MTLHLLLTAVLGAAVGAPEPLPLPVAHRSEAVTVRTDLGETWAETIAGEIETMRASLVKEYGPLLGVRKDPRPLTLLAFRSSAAYRTYAAEASPPHVLALGWYDPTRRLAVTHTETTFTSRHEASHWVLREVLKLPGRPDLPVWVVEGIPCMAEAGAAKGLSGYRRHCLAGISEKNLRIGFSAWQSDLGRGSDDVFYAAGWLQAHYLRSRRPEAFRAYLKGVRPRGPLPDLAKLVGISKSALESEILKFATTLPKVEHAEAARRFPSLIPDDSRPASEAEVFRQVEFLRSPDKAVQHVALRWFGNHEHPATVPSLVAILPEVDERTRLHACNQIMRTRWKLAAPTLVGLLEAEDAGIRKGALATLKRLNRQRTLGFAVHASPDERAAAVARWRDWLESVNPAARSPRPSRRAPSPRKEPQEDR